MEGASSCAARWNQRVHCAIHTQAKRDKRDRSKKRASFAQTQPGSRTGLEFLFLTQI